MYTRKFGVGMAALVGVLLMATATTARAQPNAGAGAPPVEPTSAIVRRPLQLPEGGPIWGGLGVCYGAFRDGQRPYGEEPTIDQVREDLHILARHWRIARMYGSLGAAELACRVIREDKLPLKLMVGAWIDPEFKFGEDEARTANEHNLKKNRAEVGKAIELANAYPEVVFALNIGNEALVNWSPHRVPTKVIIKYLREARQATKVPVTTCDTELFWRTPESVEVARECDFLGFHAYAMWNKQSLSQAMTWTRAHLAEVRAKHPDLPIVLCETGWATQKGSQGYQAEGITAKPSEEDQELFFRALRDWAIEAKQPYFYFSAFDENWKGGPEPTEVEKHWGVYQADRSPKLVFRGFQSAAPARPVGK